MLKAFSLIGALFFIISVNGQRNDAAHLWRPGSIYGEVPLKGTPYYEETFKTGHVALNGQTTVLKFRLNAYEGRIEIEDKNGKHFQLPSEKGQEVVFGGKTFRWMPYFDNDVLKEAYFIPLVSGKVSLFYMPRKTFRQAEMPAHGYDPFKPAVYEDTSTYYIQEGAGQARPIRLANRPLLKFLNSRKNELKPYIKSHSPDLSTQEGAIALLTYYNLLEEAKASP